MPQSLRIIATACLIPIVVKRGHGMSQIRVRKVMIVLVLNSLSSHYVIIWCIGDVLRQNYFTTYKYHFRSIVLGYIKVVTHVVYIRIEKQDCGHSSMSQTEQ